MHAVWAVSPSPQPPSGGEQPWHVSVHVESSKLHTLPMQIQEHFPEQGAGVVVVVLLVVVLLVLLVVVLLVVLELVVVVPHALFTSSHAASCAGG